MPALPPAVPDAMREVNSRVVEMVLPKRKVDEKTRRQKGGNSGTEGC